MTGIYNGIGGTADFMCLSYTLPAEPVHMIRYRITAFDAFKAKVGASTLDDDGSMPTVTLRDVLVNSNLDLGAYSDPRYTKCRNLQNPFQGPTDSIIVSVDAIAFSSGAMWKHAR